MNTATLTPAEKNTLEKIIKLIPLNLIYNMITDDRCWGIIDITEDDTYDLARDYNKLLDILQENNIVTKQHIEKIDWEGC